MATRSVRQKDEVDDLTPNQRAEAEAYYKSKGVGPSKLERYEHFRDDPQLNRAFYCNVGYDKSTENDTSRLSVLEFMKWGWNGEI